MKIKIKTGYREDQYYTIDAEEAHKAYFLFLNPEKRGVFSNGVAVIGSDIRGIEPDWNATLGYNPTYKLDYEDWNDLRRKGTDRELREVLETAKQVAQLGDMRLITLPLSEAEKELAAPVLRSPEVRKLADGMQIQ